MPTCLQYTYTPELAVGPCTVLNTHPTWGLRPGRSCRGEAYPTCMEAGVGMAVDGRGSETTSHLDTSVSHFARHHQETSCLNKLQRPFAAAETPPRRGGTSQHRVCDNRFLGTIQYRSHMHTCHARYSTKKELI